MSMSMHVVGFRPRDEKWDKMLQVYNACQAAGTSMPEEVEDFFEEVLGDGDDPNTCPGSVVDIDDATEKYSAESVSGYDIHIDKLPSDIKVVRVYNAY